MFLTIKTTTTTRGDKDETMTKFPSLFKRKGGYKNLPTPNGGGKKSPAPGNHHHNNNKHKNGKSNNKTANASPPSSQRRSLSSSSGRGSKTDATTAEANTSVAAATNVGKPQRIIFDGETQRRCRPHEAEEERNHEFDYDNNNYNNRVGEWVPPLSNHPYEETGGGGYCPRQVPRERHIEEKALEYHHHRAPVPVPLPEEEASKTAYHGGQHESTPRGLKSPPNEEEHHRARQPSSASEGRFPHPPVEKHQSSGRPPPPHEEEEEEAKVPYEPLHEEEVQKNLPAEPEKQPGPNREQLEQELMISFVASYQLLHQHRLDLLSQKDFDVIVRMGKSEVSSSSPDDTDSSENPNQPFEAVAQLSTLLESNSRLLQLLNGGYFAYNQRDLLRCLNDSIREANFNGQSQLALFCVNPEQRVFLAIYYRGRWYLWKHNDQVVELRDMHPDRLVARWINRVPPEEGCIVKAVILLPEDDYEERKTTREQISNPDSRTDQLSSDQQTGGMSQDGMNSVNGATVVPSFDMTSFANLPPLSSNHRRATSTASAISAIDANQFMCPISKLLMADPVTAADGYSYDRPSIETHFLSSDKSPLKGTIIPKTLFENRSLRDIIEAHVEAEVDHMDPEEVADFRRRQMERVENDRRRFQLEPPSVPEPPPPREPENNTPLCQLIRLDKPDEDSLFGPDDSGVSVSLGDESSRPETVPESCSVGCCLSRLTSDPSYCRRCQRAVCRDCLKVEVSDISLAEMFKPQKVCVECAWQITDVMTHQMEDDENMQSARERILLNNVAPRLRAMHVAVLEAQHRSLLAQVVHESPIRQLLELEAQARLSQQAFDSALTRLLEDSSEGVPVASLNEPSVGSAGQAPGDDSSPMNPSLVSLGRYDDSQSPPLGLSFPTTAMHRYIEDLRRRKTEVEPVLHGWAYRMSLRNVKHRSHHGISQGTAASNHGPSVEDMVSVPDVSSIADDLILQVDSDEPNTRNSPTLRMCGICTCGPFECLPSRGCPNCKWHQRDFSEWPVWDGEVFGERRTTM